MSDLPEGWDLYDPNDHELTGQPEYEAGRARARARHEARGPRYWIAVFRNVLSDRRDD